MKPANPTLYHLSHLLLTRATGGSQDSGSLADAMTRACERLRLHLGKLMGLDGFTLLLVRALTFARADFPWLDGIQAERDGSLTGLNTAASEKEPAEALAGFATVLSHFLGLVVAFIGEDLMLRLIQGAWPDVDLGSNTPLDMEETTEAT